MSSETTNVPVADPPVGAPGTGGPSAASRLRGFDLRGNIARFGTLAIVIAMVIYFSARSDGRFLTWDNFSNIITGLPFLILLAGGLTVCLVVRDFDLSIANVAVFAAVVSARIARDTDSTYLGFAGAIAACGLIGLLNGFIVTKLRVNAFIATLSMGLFVVYGLGFIVSGRQTISEGLPTSFGWVGSTEFLGERLTIYLALAVAVVLWVMLRHTVLGRRFFAVGENPEAARLVGIKIDRVRIMAFVISGVCAGIAGVLLASTFEIGDPTAQGTLMLDAFTAAFLGAAAYRHGLFNIPGTVFGALILGMIINGTRLVGVEDEYAQMFKGALLILAIAASGLARRS
jgi:ribose transport system permease protein